MLFFLLFTFAFASIQHSFDGKEKQQGLFKSEETIPEEDPDIANKKYLVREQSSNYKDQTKDVPSSPSSFVYFK